MRRNHELGKDKRIGLGERNETYKTMIKDWGASGEDGNVRRKLRMNDKINRVNKFRNI